MSLKSEMVASGLFKGTAFAVNGSISTGLTAAGTTQATALPLTSAHNIVGTTAVGTGVILASNLGITDKVYVKNEGANALLVYPPSGGTINGGSANAAVSVAAAAGAWLLTVDEGLTFHTM